jgi:DnaJ-class molecular chaperone
MVDLYGVLGVAATADARDIRRAYLRLVQEYHPDRDARPESTERFLQLQAAYEELGNPEKRQRYDARRPGFSVSTAPKSGASRAEEALRRIERSMMQGPGSHRGVKVRIH